MIHAFGDFELDDSLFELRRDGRVLKLPPKTFDLLLYLVRHRDRVVSKSELLDRLWPGEHVTEAVLPTNVSAARSALGDARGPSGMIQTVHGRGYRFVAPVEERMATDGASPEPCGEKRLFVGRDDVMGELVSQLGDCFDGRGRVALLVGEPGIGKTCTAFELAAEARRRGALVLEGRATEGEGAPAFWPWMQALRGLVSALGSGTIAASLGPGTSELARLLPELREGLSDLAEPEPLESAQARFRLFDALTSALQAASRERPLVVSLDDLHWADEPSLLLFRFLAREIRRARVLLLGAYRDVELRRQHPLAAVLGELAREPHYRRVPLSGLREEDVATFIDAASGRAAPRELVGAVFRMTEGNPFFVHETVRLLIAEGRLDDPRSESTWEVGLPEGVREVIGRRLDRLSRDCNRALTLAAVIGRGFDVHVLERVCEIPAGEVLDLLDEAESARIVAPVATSSRPATPGHYAFAHALVRETLYDELTGPQRVRLHRRVAETLEALGGERSGIHLAELARQFFQAAPGGDVERALDYCVRAGEAALELLAWEEAVAHFERALQAVELATPVDDERRCELILALGRALWQAGRYPEGRRTFSAAAALARKLGRADLLAHAAVGLGGWPQFFADEPPGGPADAQRALLEEALEGLPADALASRARVLSGLAGHTDMALRRQHSREAVELARASGDPDALFDALYARLVALLGPDDTQRRLEAASELLELAIRSGRRDRIFMAREARIRPLLLLGDIPAIDRELEACEELAAELRLPIYHHSIARFRLTRALGDGRLDEVVRQNLRVRELGAQSGDWAGDILAGGIDAWVALLRGDPAPLEKLLEQVLELTRHLGPMPHAFAAYFFAEVGRPEAARHELEQLVRDGFARVPRDESWLITVGLAGLSAARLGERESARRARELLEPHAALLVGHQHMRIYLTPVQAVLASTSRVLGERERAQREYEGAIGRCDRIGARPAGVVVRRELADLLESGRASPDDRRRAKDLRSQAGSTARDLGIT